MAIAFRSQTSLGGTASSVSAVKPSGAVAGDILIVDIIADTATVSVVPSGWTAITSVTTGLSAKLFAYWHVVGASDPGPWAFTLSASAAYSHICACYSGVDNTTPLDVAASTIGNNTINSAIVVPAVSPVTANTMLHSGVGEGATNRTITNPTGMTSIVEVTVGRRQEAAWQAIAATGTTGTRTWTFSGNVVLNAYMVPLRPAAAGPTTHQLAGTSAGVGVSTGDLTLITSGGGGYATITVAGSNKVGSAAVTAGTAITIPKPIGYTSALDDIIVVALNTRATAATAFTLAGGSGTWTESVHGQSGATAPSGAMWWKRVTNTTTEDAATWTYSMDTSAQSGAAVAVYRNVDTTTAIHATTTPATGTTATTTANTLTPTTDGTMLIFATVWNASTSITITTQPSGYTLEQQNTSNARVDYYDLLETAATASTPSEVMSGAAGSVAMLIALKPASTGPVTHQLAGTSGGVGAETGAPRLTLAESGTSAGVGDATAAIGITLRIAATSAGIGAASGAIGVTRAIAGTSAGIGNGSSALRATWALAATSAGVGGATADLTLVTAGPVTHQLAGTSAGVGGATAAISVTEQIAGTSAGIGSATGTIRLTAGLAATSAGVGGATANARETYALAGTSAGVGGATGTLTAQGVQFVAGISAGVGAATGTLSLADRIATTSAGIGSSSAALRLTLRLDGQTLGAGDMSGTLRLILQIIGVSSGVGGGSGEFPPLVPPPGIIFPAGIEVIVYSAARDPLVFAAGVPNPTFSGGG